MRFHRLEEGLLEVGGVFTDHIERLILALRGSQKFYLGAAELLPDKDVDPATFPRLPYPRVLFEVEAPQQVGKPLHIYFCLMSETDHLVTGAVFSIAHGFSAPIVFHGVGELNRQTQLYAWSAPRYASDMLYEQLMKQGSICAAVMNACGLALEVLSCVNVSPELMASPIALNRKRARAGKPLIYEYKILVLRRGHACAQSLGGSHDSPRIHLRRGHVKRRKTGKFWWNGHVVGDRRRGVVVKDYDASRLDDRV